MERFFKLSYTPVRMKYLSSAVDEATSEDWDYTINSVDLHQNKLLHGYCLGRWWKQSRKQTMEANYWACELSYGNNASSVGNNFHLVIGHPKMYIFDAIDLTTIALLVLTSSSSWAWNSLNYWLRNSFASLGFSAFGFSLISNCWLCVSSFYYCNRYISRASLTTSTVDGLNNKHI